MPLIAKLQISEEKIIEVLIPDHELPDIIICRPTVFILDGGLYRPAVYHEFPDLEMAQRSAQIYREAQK